MRLMISGVASVPLFGRLKPYCINVPQSRTRSVVVRRAYLSSTLLSLRAVAAGAVPPRPCIGDCSRRHFAAMGKSTVKRQVVGVVSQKGGVGKSTLCHLIARE